MRVFFSVYVEPLCHTLHCHVNLSGRENGSPLNPGCGGSGERVPTLDVVGWNTWPKGVKLWASFSHPESPPSAFGACWMRPQCPISPLPTETW